MIFGIGWLTIIKFLLLLNAVMGSLLFVWVWRTLEMHRKDNWMVEKKAISTCRRDVKRWNKVHLFLGSITIALPRLILCWTCFGIGLVCLKIVSLGVPLSDTKDLTGWRRSARKVILYWLSWATSRIFCMREKVKIWGSDEVDYSYHLGKDYKEQYKPPSKDGIIPTIICNHQASMDI